MKKSIRNILVFLPLLALILTACNDDDSFSASPFNSLTLGVDTVFMDTVFSKVPASMRSFWIYNKSGDGIRCSNVRLQNGNQTGFRTGNYEKTALNEAKTAQRKSYKTLLERHISDYKKLYDRVNFELCDNSGGNSALPTNERLELFKNGGNDNKLAEMYFNFSRYLMISGSREGTLPLNLQGIWNKDMWPAWGGKYTININTEMNYWGAEIQNLPECHTPLFDHIERMRENGRITAREMYGCKGMVKSPRIAG